MASAIGSNVGPDPVTVSAYATGGSGGGGVGTGCVGGNGAAANLGQVSGSSSGGGNVTVIASVTGGSGGYGYTYTVNILAANGGNGADASLTNAVSGSTSGSLTLIQQATGGAGGGTDGGTTGIAGNASSKLTLDQNGSASLIGKALAYGGGGGNTRSTSAGAGGTACSMINLTGSGNVNATAQATGGGGGAGYMLGTTSGNGGSATAVATGYSIGSSSIVNVAAIATGGDGGNTDYGVTGTGGNAIATATGPSSATVVATAQGGSGGAEAAPSGSTPSGLGSGASASAIVNFGNLTIEQDSPPVGSQGGYAQLDIGGEVLSLGSGNPNNGTLTLAGSGTVSIAGIAGSGNLIIGVGLSAISLQLLPVTGSSTQASLTINSTSSLDLAYGNNFIVNYGSASDPISTIIPYLHSGFASGWSGTGIISSTVAGLNAGQSALVYSVGYADGADGITSVPSGEIEIMPTLAGDAKLQGNVVFGDFQLLSQYFGQTGTSWDEGNFTYGSSTDFGDFQLLSQNFGASASALTAGEIASLDGFAAQFGDSLVANPDGVGFRLVSVPEPTASLALAWMSFGFLNRRQRKRKRVGSR
jgi:hypothetical protein